MINVVHLTDLHFASKQGALPFENAHDETDAFAQAALAMLFDKRGRKEFLHGVDKFFYKRNDILITRILFNFVHTLMAGAQGLVITGDLATRGFKSDLAVAANHILRKSAKSRGNITARGGPTFNASNRPIVLMPGNHDRFIDKFGYPGGEEFDSTFGSQWQVGPGGVQAIPMYGGEGETIYFVSADLCLANLRDSEPAGLSSCAGQGRCYEDTILRLNSACSKLRTMDPAAGIVLCVHFPPYNVFDSKCADIDSRLRLINYGELLKVADQWDVSCILAGHLHQSRVFAFGSVSVIACGSGTIFDPSAGNWVHQYGFTLTSGRQGMTEAKLAKASAYQLNYDTQKFQLVQQS